MIELIYRVFLPYSVNFRLNHHQILPQQGSIQWKSVIRKVFLWIFDPLGFLEIHFYFSGNPKSILKVLVGKTPATDFKTLSQECGLQCETNGSYNKYKHWKHDSEASLKPPSRFRVAAVQAKVLFRFKSTNESIKGRYPI